MAIGGNTTAILQVKTADGFNPIGEREQKWADAVTLVGFIDLASGSGDSATFPQDVKMRESSHIFITDYAAGLPDSSECRLRIGAQLYKVQAIDDPMKLHRHIEIYLKSLGGDAA